MRGSRVQADRGPKRLDLARPKRAVLSGLERTKQERADTHALQSIHGAAQCGEHAPNLALATFDEDQAHDSAAGRVFDQSGAHGARQTVVQDDAFAELFEVPGSEV
jgi:hypothetical protein